jgi:cobalt-zinc-cadmium efflux system protein
MAVETGVMSNQKHEHQLTREKLRMGFFLTLLLLLVELVGGMVAHSLALFSDAGHMLTDIGAFGLAWFAAVQAERPANQRRTYGYQRISILTALVNGVALVAIVVVITLEAFQRFRDPQKINPGIMLVAAAIAILINLYILLGLQKSEEHNLNTRAALLHVAGDIGASVGVIVGAILIAFTGAYWIDPLISVLIAALVAVSALRLIRETVDILMESTPRNLSLPDLLQDMLRVPGIRNVHDLHVWSITSGVLALSCHAVIDDLPPSGSAPILDAVTAMLCRKYGISHTTIQFESVMHGSHEGFCACPPGNCSPIYCDLRPSAQPEHTHRQQQTIER